MLLRLIQRYRCVIPATTGTASSCMAGAALSQQLHVIQETAPDQATE